MLLRGLRLMSKILVVDDEFRIREIIRKYADMSYMVLKDDCAYFTPKGYLV